MKQNLLQSLRLRFALLVALLCSLGTGTAWAGDVTATLTGSSMVTGESTSYSDYTSTGVTDDDGNVWYGRWCYQKSGKIMYNMIQLRAYSNSTDNGNCSRLNVPTFGGTIKTITLNITNTSAADYSTGTGCTTTLYLCTAYSKSGVTAVQTESSASNRKTVTFDLTEEDDEYTGEGLYICANGGVRIWSVAVTYSEPEPTICATPTIYPATGAVGSGTEVIITCATEDASIYYTIGADPADPTSGSTLYDPENKPTITEATTIKAIAIKGGLTNSAVASASYTIATPCATPTFSEDAGELEKNTSVTISSTTTGSTIYYTTDGSDPTTESTHGTAGTASATVTISTDMTVKAIAVKDGNANSAVASAAYTVRDYATLSFYWAGGTSSEIGAVTGITTNGLGDYAPQNAPYRVKMDGQGDYIQVKTNAKPGRVYVGIKMIGGGSTSKIKVQESANGSTFTDVQELTISGSQNDVVNLATSEDFKDASRYVRITMSEKGSNIGVGPITITGCESVTVTGASYATYASTNALDFSNTNIKAYIAAANGTTGVNFTQVKKVPANTGVLLYKDGGATEYIPIMTGTTDDVTGNIFVKGTGSAVASEDGTLHNYILNNGSKGLGFYRAAGQTVAKNRAYIQIDWGSSVKEFISIDFDSIVDGIGDVRSKMDDVRGEIFNLAGQKMSRLQKGINIVNGKKVFVK